MRKTWVWIIFLLPLGLIVLCLAGWVVSRQPIFQDRFGWRLENLVSRVQRILNPPEMIVFVPLETESPVSDVDPLETTSSLPLPVITRLTTLTETPHPQITLPSPVPSPTPEPSATPLPDRVVLDGIVHEYQQFNNCGPTNLAMALSYWGWKGDQRDTRRFLRPNIKVDDKNVMPSEMVDFVENTVGLRAIARVGGDLEIVRSLIAAGFPVMIEAGHQPPDDWWMGHYLVINGYDDAERMLIAQDSLANPDVRLSYDEIQTHWWRDFNYVYLVIFPADREAPMVSILGPRWDEQISYQLASQKALDEISTLTDRDLFFAWFNLGSSSVGLEDYASAASAFDKAFELYQSLSEAQRPYRLMWYQTGPYQAYYNSGRYQDVINLANTTFAWVGKPVLEESYYWRGMAYLALGMQKQAVADFQKAAELNPNYAAPRGALLQLGVQLP